MVETLQQSIRRQDAEQRRREAQEALATELAARSHGRVVTWQAALDNHEPTRAVAWGHGAHYVHEVTGARGFKFWPGPQVRDPHQSVYLIDDGVSVVPHYVAGRHDEEGSVLLHEFPTNPNGARRPDNGREIDHSAWMVGPRRAYHLKTRPVISLYAVTMRHDAGEVTLTVAATSADKAVEAILKAEGAPARSVVRVESGRD